MEAAASDTCLCCSYNLGLNHIEPTLRSLCVAQACQTVQCRMEPLTVVTLRDGRTDGQYTVRWKWQFEAVNRLSIKSLAIKTPVEQTSVNKKSKHWQFIGLFQDFSDQVISHRAAHISGVVASSASKFKSSCDKTAQDSGHYLHAHRRAAVRLLCPRYSAL